MLYTRYTIAECTLVEFHPVFVAMKKLKKKNNSLLNILLANPNLLKVRHYKCVVTFFLTNIPLRCIIREDLK